jgi:integrase
MASITKTHEGTFRARIKVKGRVVASNTFPTHREAKDWSTEQELQLRRRPASSQGYGKTVNDLVDEFNRTAPSIRSAGQREKHLAWWVADAPNGGGLHGVRLSELSRSDVRVGIKRLEAKGLSGGTVRNYVVSLSRAITYAVADLEWLSVHPLARMTLPAKRDPGASAVMLTDEQEAALLAAASKSDARELRAFVEWATYCGARRNEMLDAKRSEVSACRTYVAVPGSRTKGQVTRVLPLPPGWLDRMVARVDGYLFGPQLRHGNIQRYWPKVTKEAGVPWLTVRQLRHHTACKLVSLGRSDADLFRVSKLLGHRDVSTTAKYYAKLAASDVVATANARTAAVTEQQQTRRTARGRR